MNEINDTVEISQNTDTPARVYFSRWTTSSNYSTTEHVDICVWYLNGRWDQYSGKNTWYNRPWQEFTYQSAGINAAAAMLKDARAAELELWKGTKGYRRMTEKRRAEWDAEKTDTWAASEMHGTALMVYLLAKNDFTLREYAPVLDALKQVTHIKALGKGVYEFYCPTNNHPRRRFRWNSRAGQYLASAIQFFD